jgi:microcystin-dependent protein
MGHRFDVNLVLSVVVGGLAIHGVIAACGSVATSRPTLDAQASDTAGPVDTAPPSDTALPSGTIVAFGGTTAPTGWTLCDGSAISRITYAPLFAAVGINFGGGDGINTFNLPDLRGRFLRGTDGGAGRDPDADSRSPSNSGGPGGDMVGSLQGDATAVPANPFATESTGSHTHANGTFNNLLTITGLNTASNTDNIGPTQPDITQAMPLIAAGEHQHRLGGGFGTGGDKETRPKNVAVNYIIKL